MSLGNLGLKSLVYWIISNSYLNSIYIVLFYLTSLWRSYYGALININLYSIAQLNSTVVSIYILNYYSNEIWKIFVDIFYLNFVPKKITSV